MHDKAKISISIVSHGQGALVANLLSDLQKFCATPIEVILTLNVEEILPFTAEGYRFPVEVVRNVMVKGFGANHNAAFKLAKADYFCVLNPDIRLEQDPFPALLEQLSEPSIGVVGPLVVNPSGDTEDSARHFPTPMSILKKASLATAGPEYEIGQAPVFPDWIAGMFMVFRSEVFRSIGGFDEHYFLYYEDVDLCWRLRHGSYQVMLISSVRAVHDARRESHRNFRYLHWHLKSMLRFFAKCAGAVLARS